MEGLLAEGARLQSAIWKQAVTAAQRPDATPQATQLLMPALNEMIDITATREMATRNHPPLVVYLLLGGLSLICALLVGYDTCGERRTKLAPHAYRSRRSCR